ncbi:P22 coat protein - protein 5 domain protein [Bacillus velezensis]|uniref:phage major capsid protein n=1 Tax=Bacillus velezensis TaxID=492670 RepID=UPI000BA7BABD|nr:P22 coat protein - protein 5 domain protein [Bacillus velezensis]PAC78477.1 P22 coat protein - protein 5 domain protein [Bacillus velezensis]
MSVQNFIPTVWSTKLNQAYDKAMVYGNLVNSDYQGDVSYGNTVKINTFGEITIGDYGKNGVGDPQELDSSQTELHIDQRKFFNFKVEDVDAAQANINLLNGAMNRAAYGLADTADQFIANLYTEVDSKNVMGSDTDPIQLTKLDTYDILVDLNTKLSEANVPKSERYAVVPEFAYGLLQKDDRFTKFQEILLNGYIGNVGGLQIYTSNNVPVIDGKYKIMAGHRSAITFASQLNKLEAYRPEKYFADAIKGLQVYGAKVIKPTGIAVLTASK